MYAPMYAPKLKAFVEAHEPDCGPISLTPEQVAQACAHAGLVIENDLIIARFGRLSIGASISGVVVTYERTVSSMHATISWLPHVTCIVLQTIDGPDSGRGDMDSTRAALQGLLTSACAELGLLPKRVMATIPEPIITIDLHTPHCRYMAFMSEADTLPALTPAGVREDIEETALMSFGVTWPYGDQ